MPLRHRHRPRPIVFVLESRTLLSDVTVLSATELDFRNLSISYQVAPSDLTSLSVNVYRSADPVLDPATDALVGEQALTGPDVAAGRHDGVAIRLATPLASGALPLSPDPARPYVFAAVTGPDGALSTASFRKYVIGVVTHGYTPPDESSTELPAWVTQMATTLGGDKYDHVVAFNWVAQSMLLSPGQATGAGVTLARQVEQFLAMPGNVAAGAVVDLHFIGHSRGTVVINQAFTSLQQELPADSPARAGYWRETFLDPHPAHAKDVVPFSVTSGSVGKAALALGNLVQEATQDPYPLMVPSNVSEVQDYYERSPTSYAPDFSAEGIISPNGTLPPEGIVLAAGAATQVRTLDLTTPGIVHDGVHIWYQANVAPRLATSLGFVDGPVDAPVFASAYNLEALAGFTLPHLVGSITTLNPNSVAGNLKATIDWGDGQTSAGSIHGSALTGFFVTGSHDYAKAGDYATTLSIIDVGGSTASAAGTATVHGFSTIAEGSAAGTPALVTLRRSDTGAVLSSFAPYDPSYTGGVRVATGDVDGDGTADVITAPAAASSRLPVRIFSGRDGHLIRSFSPFGVRSRGPGSLAGGDVDGDGKADVIVGRAGVLRILSGATGSILVDLRVPLSARAGSGGLVVRDTNGDGLADVVTRRAATGPIRVSDSYTRLERSTALELARVRRQQRNSILRTAALASIHHSSRKA